jgi:hypothetical protein
MGNHREGRSRDADEHHRDQPDLAYLLTHAAHRPNDTTPCARQLDGAAAQLKRGDC